MTGILVLVQRSSGRSHPPPSPSVARNMACQISPDRTVLWKFREIDLSYSSNPLLALTYLEASSASVSLTRILWRPLSQRYILLVTCDLIYLALRTPNIFLR